MVYFVKALSIIMSIITLSLLIKLCVLGFKLCIKTTYYLTAMKQVEKMYDKRKNNETLDDSKKLEKLLDEWDKDFDDY